jgi:hypothetical protein
MKIPWKLHECRNLPKEGVQVLYSMDNVIRHKKTWRLVVRREATSQDLMENTILEEEGQTLWETYLEITHCPFCGEKLYDIQDTDYEDYGKFVHFDYSEWKSKKQ